MYGAETRDVFFYAPCSKMAPPSNDDGELSQRDVEKLFEQYTKTKAAILKGERTIGKKNLVERRIANSLLSYARNMQQLLRN